MYANSKADADQPITFNEAAKLLAKGSRPSCTTWWRWWRKGVKGVRLATVVIGGRRYTTAAAVEKFVADVTAAANGERPSQRTPRQRQRSIDEAEKEIFD